MDSKMEFLNDYLEAKISTKPSRSNNKKHKPPIKLKNNLTKGRFLIASKDIEPGETILWEEPLVVTPKCGSGPCCLDCFLLFSDDDWPSCRGCKAPRCFPPCNKSRHSLEECKIISKMKLSKDNIKLIKQLNIILTPLRTWLHIKSVPADKDVILSLQTNCSYRNRGKIGLFVDNCITPYLRNHLKLDIPSEFVSEVCGIYDTNAFEMSARNKNARSLLPAASLMNHSCLPNTDHWYVDGKCVIRATKKILNGEPITNTYTNLIWPTKVRRNHLFITKFFVCDCSRCEDSSECGTNLGKISCPKCTNYFDQSGCWKCWCGYEMDKNEADALIHVSSTVAANATSMDAISLLKAIKQFENSLGKQNCVIIQLQIAYLKMMSFSVLSENLESLLLAVSMSANVLNTLDKIQPGYSRIRGRILFYKFKIFFELLLRAKGKDNETVDPQLYELISGSLQTFIDEAKECIDILEFDEDANISKEAYSALLSLSSTFLLNG